jgi:hypothetical protein
MNSLPSLTPEELALIADAEFFRAKARIAEKTRAWLEALHSGLQEDLAGVALLTPPAFDPACHQFVKGEHLDHCPYQYLDYPKHFSGNDKFTFRSMFWWGHAFVFALIIEGDGLLRYKQNLLTRFHELADQDIHLCLSPSPWDWRQGDGYTLPLRRERRAEVAAVLSGRRFFKLARFVSLTDPALAEGRIVEVGRRTFQALLPVMTR